MARRSSFEPYFNIALKESRVDTLRSDGDELNAQAFIQKDDGVGRSGLFCEPPTCLAGEAIPAVCVLGRPGASAADLSQFSAPAKARPHRNDTNPRRTPSSVRPDLGFD